MKVGDLVRFDPGTCAPGALTAIKYFERMSKRLPGTGIVIERNDLDELRHDGSHSVLVAFPSEVIVIHERYLRVVDEGG